MVIEGGVPFKRMLFVCTNQRQGETACANGERGKDSGLHLVELLRAEVKRRGLKGKIRVAKSGCMDLCGAGPNIMIYDEQGATYLSRVGEQDVPAIADRFLKLP